MRNTNKRTRHGESNVSGRIYIHPFQIQSAENLGHVPLSSLVLRQVKQFMQLEPPCLYLFIY